MTVEKKFYFKEGRWRFCKIIWMKNGFIMISDSGVARMEMGEDLPQLLVKVKLLLLAPSVRITEAAG